MPGDPLGRLRRDPQETLTVRPEGRVVYRCEGGERIEARYYSLSDKSLDFVKVLLPDGREVTLPQAMSASGVRYTNDCRMGVVDQRGFRLCRNPRPERGMADQIPKLPDNR